MRKVSLPEDIESPDDSFFKHKLVEELSINAATQIKMDWNQLFSGSIEGRRDDLYCCLKDYTNTIIGKGGKGYFWIVTSQELVFVLSCKDFNYKDSVEQMPLGYDYVMFEGILQKKWLLYNDPLIAKNKMLIGAGFRKKPPAYYASVTIENFK